MYVKICDVWGDSVGTGSTVFYSSGRYTIAQPTLPRAHLILLN